MDPATSQVPAPIVESGAQERVPEGTSVHVPANPLPPGVAQVIVGLANEKPRGLASEAGVALVAGWATETVAALQRAQEENARLSAQLRGAERDLGEKKTLVAVLGKV